MEDRSRHVCLACVLCLVLSACSSHVHNERFDYLRRPKGYNWHAEKSPYTNDRVWYGTDPSNGWTVYVGPDGVYYTYHHAGLIMPDDLESRWQPHDVGT